MNNYIDTHHVKAYQGIVAREMRSSRGNSRHGPLSAARRMLASTLVLTGARLMPDTPAVVGNRALVFEPPPMTDSERKLQPAA
jgi:hypothetical protein